MITRRRRRRRSIVSASVVIWSCSSLVLPLAIDGFVLPSPHGRARICHPSESASQEQQQQPKGIPFHIHGGQVERSRSHWHMMPSLLEESSSSILMGGVEDWVYGAQSQASNMATAAMGIGGGSGNEGPTLASVAVLYFAGLLTSFSPCSLGLLPLTISYISSAAGEREDKAALIPALCFALGLASVFCGLGLSASLLGGLFGSSASSFGDAASSPSSVLFLRTLFLAAISSGVSIAMGLQLLDIIQLPLPSVELPLFWEDDNDNNNNDDDNNKAVSSVAIIAPSALVRTFLLGGSSALVASPCATPVLTSILAYVAASQNPALGSALLFSYTMGYTTPLLIVGATGGELLAKAAQQNPSSEDSMETIQDGEANNNMALNFLSSSTLSFWAARLITPLMGGVLIFYGTTGFLTALFGDPSMAGLAPILE